MGKHQRLVADVMLAKLARWLRLAGIEVEAAAITDDNRLIASVKRKNAMLLTSDRELSLRARRRKFKVLYVPEASIDDQLAFVARSLKLRIGVSNSKICTKCGGKLERVKKSEVAGKVPQLAYDKNRYFYMCKKCGKIYWKGTHWKSITKRLKKVRRMAHSY
ncbi:MAG: Mut7-C RNAse domain-containing protein [Candidatus Micrarchaeia archaeon]